MHHRTNIRPSASAFGASLRRWIDYCPRVAQDNRGSAAMLVGLALPVLLGFGAMALDVSLWYSQKRLLQSGADAAAMAAGITQYVSGATQSAMEAAATADVTANGIANNLSSLSDSSALLEIHSPPQSGAYAGDNTATEAVITQRQNLFLSGYFLHAPTQIKVRAVVKQSTYAGGSACIIALDQSAAKAISVSGGSSTTLKNCGFASNSSDPNASLYENGNKTSITASFVHLSGGLDQQNGSLTAPNIVQNGPRVGDPYHSMSTPTTSGASYSDPSPNPNATTTLNPGTYAGMTLKGNVTLNAGVYVVNSGSFTVDANATVNGSGVTIVMKNNTSVTINGGATVNMSAPTTGANAGVAFYQTPGSSTGITQKFNGGSNMNIAGALYFPKQTVSFNGGNANGGGSCTHIVARVVDLSGSAATNIDCTGANSTFNPQTPELPYLVE
jgi:hypothetical protein